MIDLHTHSLFSDGALIPAEHLRRFEALGYEAVAITDHGDMSNIDLIIPRIVQAAEELNPHSNTKLIPGIELTHVPPALIAPLTARSRELGARLVVVHGETPVEPVAPGTNRAAIDAGVDILAHPGFISEKEAMMAAVGGVILELSGRKGHSLTNGHVAKVAQKTGGLLAVNSDAHAPGDFMSSEFGQKVALGAGLNLEQYGTIRKTMSDFARDL